MRIQFCGADRTVTGSSHLIEVNGLRVLLDCGLYQGSRDEADRLNRLLPPDPAHLDAVILSHGHLDHCGRLPALYRNGCKAPIYCTAATAEVARIVMQDSAQIQEENAQYLNHRSRAPGQSPVQPLYFVRDVPPVLQAMRKMEYGVHTPIGDPAKSVFFTLFDAGHILGSAYVVLEWQENGSTHKLLFTADVGRYDSPILRDPAPPPPVDVVITESTYGNRSHGPISAVEPALLDAVKFCIERKSRLLVPSFAIGRTQTILWYVQKFIAEKTIPAIPIFVDSPMGVEATRVTTQFRNLFDKDTQNLIAQQDLFSLSKVTLAQSVDQSRQINSQTGPCVIIASSPTCEFGRILHHLIHSVENANDLVVFVGYIPPNTLGRRLQDGEKRVRILDRFYDVRCQVRTIHGLSAHADADELQRFLKPALTPQTRAYVVHGEVDQAEGFAQRLTSLGVSAATVPAMDTSMFVFASAPPAPSAQPAREED